MKKKKLLKRSFAILMTLAVTGTTVLGGLGKEGVITAQAAGTAVGKGTIATTVTGSYSWDTGSATNASLLDKLPTIANKGTHRFTTDNYDSNNKAIDTSNWGTSMMWNLNGGNAYGNSVYAIPWAFKADETRQGMLITKPITTYSQGQNETGTWMAGMAENGSTSEFVVKPGYTTNGVKVDNVTDWTYDVVMQNASNTSQYMKTTMVQGSPFAYFEMVGTDTMTVERPRSLDSSIVSYDGSSAENSTMLVVRVFDNHDETRTGDKYDYYAFFVPQGTTWEIKKASENQLTSLKANFPSGKSYFTVAVLTELPQIDDNAARAIADLYKPYAYNFVTDTRAEYSYNENTQKLSTTFTYTVDKKAESTAEGTIMGILPHQYKNMSGYNYLSPTLKTIRGTMKTLAGSSFKTELTYTGVLPWLANVSDTATLGKYVDEYMDKYFPNGVPNDPFAVMHQGNDTYGTGKALNRTSNVIAAAEAAGKADDAATLLEALKGELQDWFTATGEDGDKYFYYDKNVGSLYGFPQSYSSVDQTNDHHFHYGYFIYAAAQIALRDPEWASDSNWGLMVKELINDIACTERNSSTSRYPYLRNFAPYEGHSWASGHSNFSDGNNHESSSEAMNAWAGIILFGEAIGDKELRDLGIYLYTTEISAINNYWFDVDEDVLDDNYRYYGQKNVTEDSLPTYNQAAQVWGGKMDYATWWTAEPLQIQGINLLPMNPASFYLAGNDEYILENWKIALEREARIPADRLGDTYEEYTKRWNDVWSAYLALANPDTAISYWQPGADEEGGESRAHTYQYIYSLKEYGTPDTSVTSNAAMSAVFNKDGVKTYAVFNAGKAAMEVTFSDGIKVNAQPGQMTLLKGTDIEGVSAYTVEYYKEKLDGGYEKETVTKAGMDGSTVQAEQKEIPGYSFDSENSGNKLSGTVTSNNGLVLKLYYKRSTYTINYELNGGSMEPEGPSSYKFGQTVSLGTPSKENCDFLGWFTDASFKNQLTEITETTSGNLTLYAKWKDLTVTEAEEGKSAKYEDDNIIFAVTGESGIKRATVYYQLFDSEDEAKERVKDAGVAGTMGMNLNNDGGDNWSISIPTPNAIGKFIVFKYNIDGSTSVRDTAWGIHEIAKISTTAVAYKTEYYQEQLDGTFKLAETSNKRGEPEDTVTAVEKNFTGFTLDKGIDGTVASGTVGAANSLTLKLYYKRNSYTITYNLNEGTNDGSNPASYKYGESITLKNPTREGYTFGGWYESASFTGSKVTTIRATAAKNYELYAKWTEGEGGDDSYVRGDKGIEIDENGTITFYVSDPQKAGMVVFYKVCDTEEEASKITGIGQLGGHNMTQNENGEWEYKLENIGRDKHIVYAFNNGVQEEVCAIPVTEIPSTSGEGGGNGGGDEDAAAYRVEHYLQNTSLDGYTKDSSADESLTGTVGETVTANAKTYTGFTYNASAEGSAVSGTVTEDGALVLRLYYTRNSYAINYTLNGGTQSAGNPVSYLYGVGAADLKAPNREGYTFNGWYANASLTGEKVTSISGSQTGDISLYAGWTKNSGGSTETPPGSTETPPGSTETPPGSTETPPGGTETPPGGTVTPPGGGTQTPPSAKVNAAAPSITKSPVGGAYEYKADAVLTVGAKSTDGGALSYQWYSNTKNSTVNATKISGATGVSYKAPTTALGTVYYFCKVTNTNSKATGNKTAAKDYAIAGVVVTKAANPITKISSYSKAIGSKVTLKPQGSATYKTSNKKVVTVTKKGKVTFKGVGKATITVTAKGNQYYKAATKKITFTVTPKAAKISSAKSSKSKTITVKWKKDKKATGYEVQYSTSSKFKGAKSKKVKGSGTTALNISKLKGGKKYYVRVREYTNYKKKPVYGAWSKVKSIKVKK